MKYRYFISYFYTRGSLQGVGRANLERNKKIKSIKDIEGIEEIMKVSEDFDNVTIINWRLFE